MTSNGSDQYRTEVILVTKDACHLCDVAEQILIALGRTLPIRVVKAVSYTHLTLPTKA